LKEEIRRGQLSIEEGLKDRMKLEEEAKSLLRLLEAKSRELSNEVKLEQEQLASLSQELS
jgi:hypothetical protein